MTKLFFRRITIPFVLFLLFGLYLLLVNYVPTDIQLHAVFTENMMNGEMSFPGNFILYGLAAVCSFFIKQENAVLISFCFLLAVASTWRYYLSTKAISKLNVISNPIKNEGFSILSSLGFLFIFVIPVPVYFLYGRFYMDAYPPNIWHNSTTIFLFPFAFLLFLLAKEQLKEHNKKRDFWITVLIFLNIFIKPSFFFVFAVCYPFFMLVRYKFTKKFLLTSLPVIIGAVLLFIQYLVIYETDGNSSVTISFFSMFSSYKKVLMIPVNVLFSMLFPIVYTCWNFKKIKSEVSFQFVILLLLFSFVLFCSFAELGVRANHGNFFWQIVICEWLFFFQSFIFLLKDIKKEGLTKKHLSLISIFSIHILMGIIYYFRMLFVGNYF